MRIAFIGLGMMGRPMAERLIAGGFSVRVNDADLGLADAFGPAWAGTPAEAAREAEVLITMLPTGGIVREVLLGTGEAALALPSGAVVIDCSSSEAAGTVALGADLAARGITLVDAPVSGGVPLAREGKLTLMVGGTDDTLLARLGPILGQIGGRIVPVGPLGAGHAAKAINMAIAACTLAATCEGLALGARFGLDPATLLEVINNSTGRSAVGETVIRNHVLPRTYAQGFALALMTKDVGLADGMRGYLGLHLPLLEATHAQWRDALAELGTATDFSEYNRYVENHLEDPA
ncbi:NAD(P)-dependent oxidoreductase [Novosphingobium piscinae]|uniref:NAD(P)-dependent oxidoreductase n=1 Tax=Novosphingobium piscinae TaxID=1507448 RepID=A0A7X1KNZ7_9SPHN|nr:NAD(P)-dependent oxidoreductase [Novosphingobium piscinae]MBC2667875.1 NAD(P)-dependent oxidoreductase [Novosphingobium piscinae]